MVTNYVVYKKPMDVVIYNDDMKNDCTVFEETNTMYDTGLLFSNGDPIYKSTIKDPIGFKLW